MYNRLILLAALMLCVKGTLLAQLPCATDEHYHKLLQKYPQLAEYEEQFEKQLTEKLAHKSTATTADTATYYDVPIVIHVVHDYGPENLSDDALYTAAAYWARVYVKQIPDTADVIPPFIPYIGNPRMRLHLATKDPNGNPTKGIDRVFSYLSNNADDQAKYNQWPQNEYVNIWLIGTFGAGMAGVAAYAILPGTVAYEPYYDGIISLASYSDPSTKTIPHEMGHVMNLQHTWGNTNNPGVACGDDHVDDTPPTKGHLPSGCTIGALYDTACATGYHKYYTSSSGMMDSLVDYPDTVNSQNIMDYTYCDKMFTKGQAARMRTALTSATGGRNNLITPGNLAATGALAPMPDLPPVADFIVNRAVGVATGSADKRSYFLTVNNVGSFQFKNASWNDTISDVQWTFSNGATTPTSTSMTTVTNQFTQTGWVTVSLVANSNAGTNTLVNPHAVYVADSVATAGPGYSQQFATPADFSNWPMFNYYNNYFKWEYYNGTSYDGDNGCVRYRSFDTSSRLTGIAIGDHDDFFTPGFDLGGASGSVYFNFYTSGAYTQHNIGTYDPHQEDSLEVDVSTNGGAQWFKLAGYHTSDLENNGVYNTEFVPTNPTQWMARAISVPGIYFSSNVFFRFRFWPGNMGNNLYLDNFAISPFPAGVKDVTNVPGSFNLFPNPTNSGCTMAFRSGISGETKYCIRDVTGKTVFEEQGNYAPGTLQQVNISRSVLPVAGMYFVTLTIDGTSSTQKLVVY